MTPKKLLALFLFFPVNIIAQQKGIEIPFRLFNNHVYIRGAVNDSIPVWILLDSGAPTMISEGTAIKSRIKLYPQGWAEGIGDNAVRYQMTDSASFTLGDLVKYVEKNVPALGFTEIEQCAALLKVDEDGKLNTLPTHSGNIQSIDAILGDKFFQRFVIRVDCQKKVLTLY